jgi:O-antigen/teichoic acid export membrane protein
MKLKVRSLYRRLPGILGINENTLSVLFKSFSSQLMLNFIGLVRASVWARCFSQTLYGQFILLNTILESAQSLVLPGLSQSALNSAAKKKLGNFRTILKYKFAATTAASAILIAYSAFFYNGSLEVKRALLICALLLPFLELQRISLPWLVGSKQVVRGSKHELAVAIGSLTLLGTLSVVTEPSLTLIVSCLLGFTAVFWAVFTLKVYKEIPKNSSIDTPTIVFGLKMSAVSLMGWVASSDKLLIGHHLSAEALATYSLALIFPSQIRFLFVVFSRQIEPRLASYSSVEDAWNYMRTRLPRVWAVFIFVMICGYVIVPLAIRFILSEKYIHVWDYGIVMWTWWCLTTPLGFIAITLTAQQKIGYLVLHSVAHPMLTLALNLLLIPRIGIWGAIASSYSTSLLLTFFQYGYLRKVIKIEKSHGKRKPHDAKSE